MSGATVLRGFADPVVDTAHSFRALMAAMAHPGTIQRTMVPGEAVGTLPGSAVATLLCLADFETPVWFDSAFARTGIGDYLGFHTGAPRVTAAEEATFALAPAASFPALRSRLRQGTDAYPDRSATAVLVTAGFDEGLERALSGPGVKGSRRFRFAELNEKFVAALAANREMFPRGVDLIIAGPAGVAALPRTTRVEV